MLNRTRGWEAGSGFESRQACFFFSRLSFRNYLSCVFNCDDLLGRSVISSPRSSTEVIVVLLIKPTAFVLYQTVHGNDWLYTETVHTCFFLVALWLLRFVHFKPPSRLVKFS